MASKREVVATGGAPEAIGPYSQGIKANGFVFVSGQMGADPATGQLVEGGVAAQTRRVLQNISAILEAAGTSISNVVRVSVALQSMDDFAAMNEVYAEFFPPDQAPPARMTVAVAALPKNALVEMEAMALAS